MRTILTSVKLTETEKKTIDVQLNEYLEEHEVELKDCQQINFSSDHKSVILVYLAEDEVEEVKPTGKKVK